MPPTDSHHKKSFNVFIYESFVNSEAYWEQNANYPNDYDLIKVEYIMGKSIMFDKWKTNIYGWVHEVMVGENRGKIEAGYPTHIYS